MRYSASALPQREHVRCVESFTSWGKVLTAPCPPDLLEIIGEILCSVQMGGITTLACWWKLSILIWAEWEKVLIFFQ